MQKIYRHVKEELLEVSKIVYNRGLMNAYEGNLSIFHEDCVYITPSGFCKGFLKEQMITVTDIDGNILETNDYKPSSELKLHLGTYKERKDIRGVIHAHSTYATAFALTGKAIETKAYPELIVFFEKVPLAGYGTPGTDEVFDGVKKYISNYDVVLMENHGVVCLGKSLFDAFFKLETIEGIAKTLTITKILGGEKAIPENKLQELYLLRKST